MFPDPYFLCGAGQSGSPLLEVTVSRTLKNEHKTDGWNTCRRLERQARPAGRLVSIIAEELAIVEPVPLVRFLCNECDEPLVGVAGAVGKCGCCGEWLDVPEEGV